jgi:cytochrome c551
MKKHQASRTLLMPLFILVACIPFVTVCNPQREASNKFTQYYNQGAQLFEVHCSNCHQENGSGLGKLFPPLNNSDYMDKNPDEVICLIRNGKKGKLVVNGVEYDKEMPAIETLTDLEVAEIATFIYNTWGRQRGIIEVKDASSILESCGYPFPKN